MISTSGLQPLINSCQELLTQHHEFWLVASLSDRSYEEGVRARDFKEYVTFISDQSLGQSLLNELRRGINGNLAEIIRRHPSVAPNSVEQSQSRGADIVFKMIDGPQVLIEIKLVYDCTFPKYYTSVSADVHKLDSRPATSAEGFLIVFFTQLPFFNYSSGLWYGNKQCGSRASYCVKKGVQTQFQYLRSKLQTPPTWPQDRPVVQPLQLRPDFLTESQIQAVFDRIFVPEKDWRFRAEEHLRDAKVGVAIWQR